MNITKCDILAVLFLVLISVLEIAAVFFMAPMEHRCILRLIHVSALVLAFNTAIAWLAIKYKGIKDKYHPQTE